MRISSPPYRWPCFYGMDTGSRGELLAANLEVDEIREYTGVDTLSYLHLDRLLEATGAVNAGFCDACLTGDYPVEIPVNLAKHVLEDGVDRGPTGSDLAATLLDASDVALPTDDVRSES